MIRRFLSLTLTFLLLAGFLSAAEIIAGKWQKVDLLPSGSPIIIKTRFGEKIECTYFDSNRDSILVVDRGGNNRRIRKEEVASVIAEKYDDRLVNGAVIGLSAGVAVAMLTAAFSHDAFHRSRANIAIFGGALFGLSGMGIGTLVDYHHRGNELIYLSPGQETDPDFNHRR